MTWDELTAKIDAVKPVLSHRASIEIKKAVRECMRRAVAKKMGKGGEKC